MSIRHALAADLPALTEALTSAFSDDPVACWMFEDAEERPAQLDAWHRFSLEMGLTRGHVYAPADSRAAAIWSPPDVTLFDELWAPRMVELFKKLLGERAGRVMQGMARGLAGDDAALPHFYLFMLGTHAGSQGQGLGSLVLEPVLRQCDAQGLPARLESSNPRNLPFYQRHGFEVQRKIELEPGGPVLHKMQRAPRGRS